MSDIKMSDVFDLPVEYVGYQYSDDGARYDEIASSNQDELFLGQYGFSNRNKKAINLVCDAINSHDRLKEENEKLKAQLRELADFAGQCDGWESFPLAILDETYDLLNTLDKGE